ncbi:hypothetical protein MK079_01085 [Candidatus Gracilibacteria bacterium]|nr:hypothetical protein [Candidatus Gracilibacteria bacterium]
MKKSKILVDASLLNKIAHSDKISEVEKISFLKFVGYMTSEEKHELSLLV